MLPYKRPQCQWGYNYHVHLFIYFFFLQIRSELFSLIQCEQVVLPFNPARVGCQLVFALRLGTTIALGGADHRVWQRLIPETAHDESGIPLTLFIRQFRGIYQTELVLTCTHTHTNDRPRPFRVSPTKKNYDPCLGCCCYRVLMRLVESGIKVQITHLRRFPIRQKFLHVLSSSWEHWHRGPLLLLLLVAMEPTTARFVLGALPSP